MEKISLKIMKEMDEFIEIGLERTLLYRYFTEGKISKAVVAQYLYNVTNLVHSTIPHLEIAKSVARRKGNQVLENYFQMKIEEESGHGVWGENDLKGIGFSYVESKFVDFPSMKKFIKYLERLASNSIVDYAVYLFYGEYLMVKGGPTWLSYFDRYTEVASEQISVIKKHVQLDQHHVAENIEFMDELQDLGIVSNENLSVVREVTEIYQEFFNDMCAVSDMLRNKSAISQSPGTRI